MNDKKVWIDMPSSPTLALCGECFTSVHDGQVAIDLKLKAALMQHDNDNVLRTPSKF